MYEHTQSIDWSAILIPMIIGFFIYTFIVRWIFLIGPRLREAKKQTELLGLMAYKLGVEKKVIWEIVHPGEIVPDYIAEPPQADIEN